MKPSPSRFRMVMVAGVFILFAACWLGLMLGPTNLSPLTVLRILGARLFPEGWISTEGLDPVDESILMSLRLPRVLLGGLIGAALALAGAQMQGVFRNALASPGIIGASAGAAMGAILALSLGLSFRSMYYVPLLAVLGSLVSILAVVRIAKRDGQISTTTLLLTGVAMTYFISAINSWIIAKSWEQPDVARRIAYWMMGGIADSHWEQVSLLLPGFLLGTTICFLFTRDLDALLEGDETAASLGVEVTRTKNLILLGAALMTGSAVAVSGQIAFVGLVVPHIVRLLVGPAHRRLLPATLLTGASFLILADCIARTAARPTEIHLGVVTSFLGAPFFIFLLMRRGDGGPQ